MTMSEQELLAYELEIEALLEADPERQEVEQQGLSDIEFIEFVEHDPELGWDWSPTTCG